MFRRVTGIFVCGITLALQAPAATMIGQYLFNNALNLGADSSGNGNNLTTTVGTPTQTTGPTGGNALLLNGSSSLQRLIGLSGYNGLAGFSFSAWVDITGAGSSGYNGIVSQDTGGCCVNRFMVNSGSNDAFINVGQHNDQTLGPVATPGTWFLYTLTALVSGGSTNVHVYVNGADVSGSPLTEGYTIPDLSTDHTYLGTGENGNVYFMTGKLADVRIYQGALTGAEVSGLFAAGPAGSSGLPEPSTVLLLGGGFVLLAARRFRSSLP